MGIIRRMGQYGRKRKKASTRRLALWGLLATAAIPGVISTAVLSHQLSADLDHLSADAAVFSALYTVPDRALDRLDERFDEEIQEPEENEEELPGTPGPVLGESSSSVPENEESGKEELPDSENSQPPEDYSIPEEYQGSIVEEDLSGRGNSDYLSFGSGLIKNSTSISDEEAMALLNTDNPIHITDDGPQVLIMHTHATESFEPYDTDTYDTRNTWRTTDNTQNIVAAGEVMAEAIRAHGIEVLHDETQHDYPSYNGAYDRSAETIKSYLEQYPSIKVVLDVHRDAVQRDTTLVKPVTAVDGKKAAQLMIIAGCDDGTMGMPNWSQNFRFAAGMQDVIENQWPGLTRPVYFCYRKYNQDLTTGSLLLEIGSHGNTLEEILYTAQLAGDSIGRYLEMLSSAE